MAPSDLASFLAGSRTDAPAAAPEGADFDPSDIETAPASSLEQRPSMPFPDGGAVVVAERFEVLTDQPLAEFDTGTASAFAARRQGQAKADLFAYVVQSGLPTRADTFGSLRALDLPSIMRFVEFGVAPWPADQENRPIIVFERPSGGRLVKSLKQKRQPMTEDQVTRTVILPVLTALRELKNRRVFHGTINPTNLFLHEGGEGAGVQLGDCVTAPAGYNQPVFFETIERGMATPSGRGNGTIAEDLYALGATVLFLLLGHNPLADLEPHATVAAKIEKGSFAAMSGDARLPLGILEPLRGLLMDDPRQRWSLEDLDLWTSGRRLSPRQAPPPKRAPRPLSFGNADYWNTRSLTLAMAASPLAANTLIESGELDTWLRRSLDDEQLAERVVEGIRSAVAGRGGSPEERRVSRVMMALDPSAPIRYRGRAVMPEGIGGALAEAMTGGVGVQEIAEIIAGQLPMFWVNVQQSVRSDFVPIARTFDTMRGHLERAEPGFGIERCLYELNPSMPCISPMLEGRCIMDIVQLLHALEEISAFPDRPREPFDRHIAAFIVSRRGTLDDNSLLAMGSADPHRRGFLLLSVFCDLQQTARLSPLPGLSAWLAELIQPVVDRFHSRTVRERLGEELEKQVSTGVFRNLLTLLNNNNLAARDANAFRFAQREFAQASQSIAARERELEQKDSVANSLGRQLAAVTASMLSAALLVVIVLVQTG
ncbi:MAG TPA: serine/threonine protein kinase [Alphaproteobacteria bacterium]|nr:serine/threonine protein kinase [Alphaproteobacteria bacterium]